MENITLDKHDMKLLEGCMELEREYCALTGMGHRGNPKSTLLMAILARIGWLSDEIKMRKEGGE